MLNNDVWGEVRLAKRGQSLVPTSSPRSRIVAQPAALTALDKKIGETQSIDDLERLIELQGKVIRQEPNFQLEYSRQQTELLKIKLDYYFRAAAFLSGLGLIVYSGISKTGFTFGAFGALLMGTAVFHLAPELLRSYFGRNGTKANPHISEASGNEE